MLSRPRESCLALKLIFALALVSLLLNCNRAAGQEEFSDQQLEFFEAQVRPLLVDKCYDCHGPEAAPLEGGLSLASRTDILNGGDTGPAIQPGQPDESLLIDAINYGEVYEMPPDTKLSQKEIDILTKWVRIGAPWPADADIKVKKAETFDLPARKSAHWCWQPIKSPVPPRVENSDWSLDPIDNFILSRLEAAGLQPSAQATKRVLIRRLYFDLIGLPPTPAQIENFLADDSKDAYSKVVDKLLASKRFGERWARHWMDLVRYAETCGHEFDYPIPHAYQYRDYLIRAFNADVPYDQLIREHLAGDLIEIPRRHPTEEYNESLLGTGFWFFHEGHHGPVDVKAEEAKRIDNQIDVMSKTFLGLTVACARCHDHKFDAISTNDYYSLYGFLKSSRRQVAMLDPHRNIEKAYAQSKEIANQAKRLINEFTEIAATANKERLALYLDAAINQLRNDPDWSRPQSTNVQGEKMRVLHSDSGTVKPQKLEPNKTFSWQGDEQVWWVDGKIGDSTTFEFDVDMLANEWEFEVFICLTLAPDYSKTKIALNDQVLHEDFDCYRPHLSTTGQMSLGKIVLVPGTQRLRLEITGHNELAIKRHMLGIDYIELVPTTAKSVVESKETPVDETLDLDLVDRLVKAITSERLIQEYHPLHLLRVVADGNQPLDDAFEKNLKQATEQQIQNANKGVEETQLFSDFNNGLPDDWFKTGFAYETVNDFDVANLSVEGEFLAGPSAIHSGTDGVQYKGVIRSPTFTIEHDKIFYRVKGKRSRIRLIVEGYQLDVYNALLFEGLRIELPNTDDYRWIEQARDVKNHKGHRAHIEIIDQAEGYLSVDEIRFSNGPAPADPPSQLAQAYVKQLGDQRKLSTQNLAKFCVNRIIEGIQKHDPENVAIRSWIFDNNLGKLFDSKSINDVSQPELNPNLVSLPGSLSLRESNSAARLVEKLVELRKSAQKISSAAPEPVFAVGILDGTPEDELVFIRGNHKTLGEVASRDFLAALTKEPMDIESGSGRIALADRIADRNNPLTTRVVANRVWHHLFGRGIVRSVDNFGVLGQKPTHPELLDHLAVRFVEQNWSIKRLIRDIVHTRSYRMSSNPSEENKTTDPNNDLFHSANIHRLEGESIRDAILMISGELNNEMFGPSVPIHLTPFMGGRGRPDKSGPLDGRGRRSVYIEVRRNFLSPWMLAFDTPIPFNSIGRRNRSNVPAQALILMNDPFVIDQAEEWAKKLIETGASNEDRIVNMYMEAFGKPPTGAQNKQAMTFLNSQAELIEITPGEINDKVELWRDLCHVLFNVKQFIYVE